MAYQGILQALPQKPSVGDQFAQAFMNVGQAGSQAMMDYYQQQEQEAKDTKTRDLLGKLTGMDPEMFKGLSPDERRDFLKQAYSQQSQMDIEKLKGEYNKSKPSKEELAEKETQDSVVRAKDTIGALEEIIERGKVGGGSTWKALLPGATDTQFDIGEFQSTVGALEASLVDMVSRGTLSNTRFEYITENLLPRPDDRVATIKGKLEGLRRILIDQYDTSGGDQVTEEMEEIIPMKKNTKKKRSLQEIYG